jgi:hypothetical protein
MWLTECQQQPVNITQQKMFSVVKYRGLVHLKILPAGFAGKAFFGRKHVKVFFCCILPSLGNLTLMFKFLEKTFMKTPSK